MTFEQVITDSLFHLPIKQSSQGFKHTITEKLNAFLDLINQLDLFQIWQFEDMTITTEYILRIQKAFVKDLVHIIESYYNGQPFKAYTAIDKALRKRDKDFNEILKIYTYDSPKSFYRMRIKRENFPLQSIDMFHIPFEMRGKVKTQRYSIPGFPCLYLGQTIYACWEEMNRPGINDFQVVRLETVKPIKYLDLTRPVIEENTIMSKKTYHYFMIWPLIACCSVIVADYSDTFKSEYIMPQLLLQWVRNNHEIDGIRYNSTHIDFHNSLSEGDFSNLILPVKQNKEQGHCNELKAMFKISEPISWQLKEFAMGGGTWLSTREDDEIINRKIQKLELIKGRAYSYGSSVLGSLERYLDGMPVDNL